MILDLTLEERVGLVRENLGILHRLMKFHAYDPIKIEKDSDVEYLCWSDDVQGDLKIMEERVKLTNSDLTDFLSLHWKTLGFFDRIEESEKSHDYGAMFDCVNSLCATIREYAVLVKKHQSRREDLPKYLSFSFFGISENYAALFVHDALCTIARLSMELRPHDLSRFKICMFENGKDAYDHKGDCSYRGCLELVDGLLMEFIPSC